MLATIQIAEIENGFIVISPQHHHHQSLIGSPAYPTSGKHYPTMDALLADASNFIGAAVDAAREGEKAQHESLQRMAQQQGQGIYAGSRQAANRSS